MLYPEKKNLPTFIARKGIEDGASYKMQLYDINTDPSEKVNVAQDHPELVNRFKNQLDSIRNLKSILARKVASDS